MRVDWGKILARALTSLLLRCSSSCSSSSRDISYPGFLCLSFCVWGEPCRTGDICWQFFFSAGALQFSVYLPHLSPLCLLEWTNWLVLTISQILDERIEYKTIIVSSRHRANEILCLLFTNVQANDAHGIRVLSIANEEWEGMWLQDK